MTLTADDIDDVFNATSAKVDAWLDEAMAAFSRGPMTRTADTIWNKQSPQMKDAARAKIPDAAALLDNLRKPRVK
jgi:hypothetical protein